MDPGHLALTKAEGRASQRYSTLLEILSEGRARIEKRRRVVGLRAGGKVDLGCGRYVQGLWVTLESITISMGIPWLLIVRPTILK